MENDDAPTTPTRSSSGDTVLIGVFAGLLAHAVGLPVVGLIGGLALRSGVQESLFMAVLLFGWTQLLYMIPLAIVLKVRGRRRTCGGLLIVTAIGFLVTSGCVGLLAFNGIH